jgi:hypothetical protein
MVLVSTWALILLCQQLSEVLTENGLAADTRAAIDALLPEV